MCPLGWPRELVRWWILEPYIINASNSPSFLNLQTPSSTLHMEVWLLHFAYCRPFLRWGFKEPSQKTLQTSSKRPCLNIKSWVLCEYPQISEFSQLSFLLHPHPQIEHLQDPLPRTFLQFLPVHVSQVPQDLWQVCSFSLEQDFFFQMWAVRQPDSGFWQRQ